VCGKCSGTGYVEYNSCVACAGSGAVRNSYELQLQLSSDIKNG